MSTDDQVAFNEACQRIQRKREKFAITSLKRAAAGITQRRQPLEATGLGGLPEIDTLPTAPEPVYACQDCYDSGWLRRDARVVSKCQCQVPSYTSPEDVPPIDMEAHGCPRVVAESLLAPWDQSRAKWPSGVDQWPKGYRSDTGETPRFLLITGVVGNGKSRAAASIMRRAMAGGVRCWWISVPLAIDEATRSIGDGMAMRTFRTKMAARLSRDLVVLDDVGNHRDTDWQVVDLYASWVRALHESRSWVVSTTNLSEADLRQFHEASASRLMAGPVIRMTGADSRRKSWKPWK